MACHDADATAEFLHFANDGLAAVGGDGGLFAEVAVERVEGAYVSPCPPVGEREVVQHPGDRVEPVRRLEFDHGVAVPVGAGARASGACAIASAS